MELRQLIDELSQEGVSIAFARMKGPVRARIRLSELGDKLVEDDYFGNITFDIDGKLVSRDLLDSLVEIYFLDRHLGLASAAPGLTVLDIGAGYGRLAHRILSALPSATRYLCSDAIAESTCNWLAWISSGESAPELAACTTRPLIDTSRFDTSPSDASAVVITLLARVDCELRARAVATKVHLDVDVEAEVARARITR